MMQRKTCASPWRKISTPATTITVLNWKIGMFAGLMVLTSRKRHERLAYFQPAKISARMPGKKKTR